MLRLPAHLNKDTGTNEHTHETCLPVTLGGGRGVGVLLPVQMYDVAGQLPSRHAFHCPLGRHASLHQDTEAARGPPQCHTNIKGKRLPAPLPLSVQRPKGIGTIMNDRMPFCSLASLLKRIYDSPNLWICFLKHSRLFGFHGLKF